MPKRDKPQLGFALRATALVALMLPLWWFVLRGPLLDWVAYSGGLVLKAIPGHAPSGVTVGPNGDWDLQLPAPRTRYRSARIVAEARVPTLSTLNLPLYWAFLLAGPWSWRLWRSFWIGSAISLAVQPFCVLAYGVHVLQLHVYPQAPTAMVAVISFADYLGANVLPYMLPMLLVLALQRDLRALVLWGEVPAGPEAAGEKPQRRRRGRSGSFR
jgi:hypothetical protein